MEKQKTEGISRFINCYVPTEACNFRCEYCYITLKKKFGNALFKMEYPLDKFRKAVSRERLGGTCIFNLCAGGETLLSLQLIPVIKVLLEEGHNVSVVTNGTPTAAFEAICEMDKNLLEMMYFKFSFQYFELLRTGKMELFFENIDKVRNAGCSFTVDITPHDRMIPHIDEIKGIFYEQLGALPHITVARDTTTTELRILTELNKEEYRKVWSVFDSPKFDFKIEQFQLPHREYCYAGDWTFSLELGTGNLRKCDGAPEPKKMDFFNMYDDPEEEIRFEAIGKNCPIAHCYNCHAFLTLGTIPELKTPTYAEMLDRIDLRGEHWLQPRIRELYSKKLGDYHNS